jgi:hypothetical protein
MNNTLNILQDEAIGLLKELIATPSFSKEEDETAGILCRFIGTKGIQHSRVGNNVYALNKMMQTNRVSYSIPITIPLNPIKDIVSTLLVLLKKMENYLG